MDWFIVTLNILGALLAVIAAGLPLYDRYHERKQHQGGTSFDIDSTHSLMKRGDND